ncbi:DUF3488 domain-containing protein [Myxococcota bacterium]|nr:DUF3488 domain-containing protein [Myxococcota bacterium]
MPFDRFHRLVTAGTLWTAFLALFLSGEFGWAIGAPAFVLLGAGPFVGSWAARKWVRRSAGVLALAVGVAVAAWGVRSGDYLFAAIFYAVFLACWKALLLSRAPDFVQVYALSFLMVISAAVVNPGLSFGVLLFPYVVILTMGLLLANLRGGVEAVLGGPGDDPRSLELALSRKGIVPPAFLWMTAGITLAVFLFSLVFFFAVPRLGLGFFAQQSRRGMAVTGFSEEVRLGDFGTLVEDPEVVMRVRVAGGAPEVPFRMKGQSLDQYDGKAWHKTTRKRRPMRMDAQGRMVLFPGVPIPDDDGGLRVQEVYLEPMAGTPRVLFGEPDILAFQRPSSVMEALRPAHWRFFVDDAGDVVVTGPPQVAITYTAWSDPRREDPEVLRRLEEPDPSWVRDLWLDLPPQKEEVRRLAEDLARGAANRYDLALRVESFLRREFTYSLDVSHGEEDPLADFLIRDRRGHCEYFASAMVVLLRLAGVPARIVNGFYGGVPNPYGGYVALRRADAHSWVEVFFPQAGFVTFDPTPPSALDLRTRSSWWKGVSDALDAWKLAWYRWVVEYNLEKQVSALAALFGVRRGQTGFAAPVNRDDLRALRDALRSVPWGRWALGIAGTLAIAWLVLWRVRTRRRVPPGLLPAADPVARSWRTLVRAMESRGVERPSSETQREFAERVAREVPEAGETARELARWYVERAFGGRFSPVPEDLPERVIRLLDRLPPTRPGSRRRRPRALDRVGRGK